MEFGKVDCLDDVLWHLPPEPLIRNRSEIAEIKLHIGTTGWGEKEWIGHLYPKGIKSADYLTCYAAVFDTIELNTTHYQIPDREKIDRWYKQSNTDFIFCPKIPRIISHHKQLGVGTGYIPLFCQSVTGLAEKLGPCFLQLPPYFHPDDLPVLTAFLKEWPVEIALHLEFRHEAWFLLPVIEKIKELLYTGKKGIVMTDVAGRRDVLQIPATNEIIFIRFVGNSGHKTDSERIERWIDTLSQWAKTGITEVYFFLHQPDPRLIPAMYQHIKMLEMANLVLKNNRMINFLKEVPADRQLKLF